MRDAVIMLTVVSPYTTDCTRSDLGARFGTMGGSQIDLPLIAV